MTYKDILKVIPTIQAASLVSRNIPKRDGSGKGKRLNKGRGCNKLIGQGMENIVGIELIKSQSDLI